MSELCCAVNVSTYYELTNTCKAEVAAQAAQLGSILVARAIGVCTSSWRVPITRAQKPADRKDLPILCTVLGLLLVHSPGAGKRTTFAAPTYRDRNTKKVRPVPLRPDPSPCRTRHVKFILDGIPDSRELKQRHEEMGVVSVTATVYLLPLSSSIPATIDLSFIRDIRPPSKQARPNIFAHTTTKDISQCPSQQLNGLPISPDLASRT